MFGAVSLFLLENTFRRVGLGFGAAWPKTDNCPDEDSRGESPSVESKRRLLKDLANRINKKESQKLHQPIATQSGWPIICSTGTGFMTRCEHCMISPFSLCSLACKRRLHLLKKAKRLVHWLQVTSILSERRE